MTIYVSLKERDISTNQPLSSLSSETLSKIIDYSLEGIWWILHFNNTRDSTINNNNNKKVESVLFTYIWKVIIHCLM